MICRSQKISICISNRWKVKTLKESIGKSDLSEAKKQLESTCCGISIKKIKTTIQVRRKTENRAKTKSTDAMKKISFFCRTQYSKYRKKLCNDVRSLKGFNGFLSH